MAHIIHTVGTAANTAYTAPADSNGHRVIGSLQNGALNLRFWMPGATITGSAPTGTNGFVAGAIHQLANISVPAGWSITSGSGNIRLSIDTAPNSETGL